MILSANLMECLGISFVLPVAQCDLKLSTQDKGVLCAVAFAGKNQTDGQRNEMMHLLTLSFVIS